RLHPDFVHYSFREVCGFEPCPQRAAFNSFIKKSTTEWHQLVDFKNQQTLPLDLSVGSLDLGNNANFSTVNAFHKTVTRLLEDHELEIGVGGYAEVRPFYTTDAYLVEGNNGPMWRTQHLGLDIWTAAETPVFAPLAGTVHSFQNNAADCDYGPTIILEHQVSEELTFYTLYGHLTLDSLDDLTVGMSIERGQPFCKIGDFPINGNWSPHLHFQIILNLFEKAGDYPGVAFPSEAQTWLSTCPPPPAVLTGWEHGSNGFERISADFLQKDYKNIKNQHPQRLSASEISHARKQHFAKNLSLTYDRPLHIVRGYGQYLYDHEGRRYLDTCNNVPHVGHQHPRVVRAAQRQTGVLNTNTRYLHQNITNYAADLLATFPDELDVVFFVNSGSEANELALRIAQTYTQQRDMIAIQIGYHGNTGGTIGVSSYKFDGKGGKGSPDQTHIVPLPDTYRGLYQNPKTAGQQYAAHVGEQIEKIHAAGRGLAGFIGESIISCGGQIVLPDGYLTAVYQQVRAAGGLCIADEVQVGFGRVGSHFWGFELQNVVPDIVTLGKPIGNGHPLAAVVTTRKIADAFANGMEYFNTFGGNPVSCAIGHEVLKVIQEEELQQNALSVGNYLLEQLRELQTQFPIIGDVRGHGLFLGFELVSNRIQKTPAAKQAKYLANRMRELGILMSTDGPDYNVIKIKPPMCFSERDVNFLIGKLGRVLEEDGCKRINP
ncbi:MAG: aminotransferase class III-fold pyridoxal phosphate-dependent enzyme, partial [Saprospiraceae bacterium]